MNGRHSRHGRHGRLRQGRSRAERADRSTRRGKAASWRWCARWAPMAASTSTCSASRARACRRCVYLESSYYQKWFLALEQSMLGARHDRRRRDRKRAIRCSTSPPLPRGTFAMKDVERVMTRGSFAREPQDKAGFRGRRPRAHEEHPSGDAYAPAALCARQGRRRRAHQRLPRVSGHQRARQGRQSAVALHGRVRRRANCGGRTAIRR